jgi:hypothetical protein
VNLRLSFDPQGAQVSVAIFDVVVDPGRLTWVKSTKLNLPGSASVDTSPVTGQDGRVRHVIQGGATPWSAGEILEITFQVAANAPVGGNTQVGVMLRGTMTAGVRVTSPDAVSGDAAAQGGTVTFQAAENGTLDVPSSLDFGKVKLKKKKSLMLIIRNAHNSETMRVTVTPPAKPFSLKEGGGTFVLGPGESRNLLLQFKPKRKGAAAGTLGLETSDTENANVDVALTGKGK